MPLDRSIKKVLIIGAGPIVIGQACEFDYSGTQACQALKEEGCEVILVNSNPATIMTDPGMADAIYIEPIHWEILEAVIQKHRPDALLPTMGGQTALNATIELSQRGILDKYALRVIGLQLSTIEKAEHRQKFKEEVTALGLEVPRSFFAINWSEIIEAQKALGFPLIVRTSFTLGGEGGGVVCNHRDLVEVCKRAFEFSQGLLIEESIIGWKEYELEVMRDNAGNCIVVCGIENLDPMGVHTGDSITVAPIQTLTDKEYQKMRVAAFKVMEAIGMTSGGCNVQFAIHPKTGKMYCIEINPRVSRSSALASKATGFPIAKIATKIALGYDLNELSNPFIRHTFPASFEPTIDYVVTKIPRFDFEKFPHASVHLTTHMKSLGEAMAIGRTFQESLLKAIASLDLSTNKLFRLPNPVQDIYETLSLPHPDRLFFIFEAFRRGCSVEAVHRATQFDLWFLFQIHHLVTIEKSIQTTSLDNVQKNELISWKQKGFSDAHLAHLWNCKEEEVLQQRWSLGIHPVYKRVDTCAAEFPNEIAYMYSTYEEECESHPNHRKNKVVILGSGPNRIGQGIEFDYCCVHAVKTAKALDYEAIIINCNPETVSTDFNIADRLYLEPLTSEHVLEILRIEKPQGFIIQMGGQTPLKIAACLHKKNLPICGTGFPATDVAENREKFRIFLDQLQLLQPRNGAFSSALEAFTLVRQMSYPLVVRPSFVIGGNAIEVLAQEEALKDYIKRNSLEDIAPVLMEEFLDNCLEVEVDAICDGESVFCCGIIEHLDPTGIHSGDSIAFLSRYKMSQDIEDQIFEQTKVLGLHLGIIGLFNVQFAIRNKTPVILEVNPRASRTIPLLSKITGLPLVQIATKCILGRSLKEQCYYGRATPKLLGMKIPVFPIPQLQTLDEKLGPQMKSTGEVLCIGSTIEELFLKAKLYTTNAKHFTKEARRRFLAFPLPTTYAPFIFDIATFF